VNAVPFLIYRNVAKRAQAGQDRLVSYLVASGTSICESPRHICRDARATPSVREPSDLPEQFEITFPDPRDPVRGMPAALGTPDEWSTWEYASTGAALRPGSTARIECMRDGPICRVSMSYAPDLGVSFFSGPDAGTALRQAQATDGFMRDVILAADAGYGTGNEARLTAPSPRR
jgi:hypothetical protein